MAIIKKDGNFMGLPMNIARGNPIPLDKSEIWYSYDAMKTYAETDAVAYVGQILGLVDEVNNTSTAYMIINTAGNLKPIGVVDNASVFLNDSGEISLKDYGKRYYKYVQESGTPGEEGYVAAGYYPQEVDDAHPWKTGLELRVAEENGSFVLAWYEQNPTTIDGVVEQVNSLQTTVNELQNITVGVQGSLANIYTKKETDEAIAAAMANSAHLQRKIVDEYADIDPNAENAESYIYMVPTGLTNDPNRYDEYIILSFDGIKYAERVGSWDVDLTGFVTETALTEALKGKVDAEEGKGLISTAAIGKLDAIQDNAERNFIAQVDTGTFVVDEQTRTLALVGGKSLNELLSEKVDKVTGKGLSTNDFTDTYKNAIDAHTTTLQTVTADIGNLKTILNVTTNDNNEVVSNTLITIQSNITTLQQALTDLNTKEITPLKATVGTLSTDVTTIKTNLGNITNELGAVQTAISDLQDITNSLDTTYVSIENFNATVGDLNTLLAAQTTIQEQITDIWSHLTWDEIKI